MQIKIKYQANYSIYITIIDSKNNLKEKLYSLYYQNCLNNLIITKTIRKNLFLTDKYRVTTISNDKKIEYYTLKKPFLLDYYNLILNKIPKKR